MACARGGSTYLSAGDLELNLATGGGDQLRELLADAAEEGRHVFLSMLVVGLVFLAVMGLGVLTHCRRARRRRATLSRPLEGAVSLGWTRPFGGWKLRPCGATCPRAR